MELARPIPKAKSRLTTAYAGWLRKIAPMRLWSYIIASDQNVPGPSGYVWAPTVGAAVVLVGDTAASVYEVPRDCDPPADLVLNPEPRI